MNTVAKELNIFGRFNSYKQITPQVRAWITMKANKRGLNPNMVHAGIKAVFARRLNTQKDTVKRCPYCKARI